METLTTRSIATIAAEIVNDWRKDGRQIYFGAVPYLDAMRQIDKISDPYIAEDGRSIVLYFLANANSWRGPVARRVKAELHAMLKGGR